MLTAGLFVVLLVTFFFVSTSFIHPNALLNGKKANFLAVNADASNPSCSFSVLLFSLYGSSPAYVAQRNLIA